MTDLTSRPVLDSYIRVSTTETYRAGVDLIAVERAVNDVPPAGMTEDERAMAARILAEHGVSQAAIARRLPRPPARRAATGRQPKHPGCGTNGGYGRHRRRDEIPCTACRAARAAAARRYRQTGTAKEQAA
ncbi:hypothetical protein [Streptomyces sp. NPDC048650]|uniref:hypothetical protein n=1 Tax=unclassified Streptomyces TaxID=2593676 RepID=UPI00371AA5D2